MKQQAGTPAQDYPVTPVPFTQVRVTDAFWRPRLETNRTVTLPHNLAKCEETGRIANFERAAGWTEGSFEGLRFRDSDVFKVIEGAAYSLHLHPDAELDHYLDQIIAKIAAAQEADGYLYTARTIDPDRLVDGAGKARWSYLRSSHELYNVGHLYEAAAAHVRATGKRSLLNVALKNAELIDAVFGPEKLRDVPGHQEIEIGLVKLYRVTGDDRWLRLARFFLDERGDPSRELYGEYAQDHLPVVEQRQAIGHAVRAGYMYSATADVAALTGDERYVKAIDLVWQDVVGSKLYLTGGIGARHRGEAFGEAYELPNATAYAETCAAIANILWNHRLFAMHGDAKYIDVLERTLYNGFLAGVGLGGDTFFYVNPLEWDDQDADNRAPPIRQPWYACSCCPTNVVRFMASVSGYVYAQDESGVYLNLYVGSSTTLHIAGETVELVQHTAYPWEGDVRVEVTPSQPVRFALRVRVPGWARGQPVPSSLYRYLDQDGPEPVISVNGKGVKISLERGYVCLDRTWRPGDTVRLELPMPVRRVLSHPRVAANAGRVALERGPLVYCAEWVDNTEDVLSLIVPDKARLSAQRRPGLLGGLTTIEGMVQGTTGACKLVAIPYYAWAHRGPGKMAVWLRRDAESAGPAC